MNQEQNNLNTNYFNTQGNNEIPNNGPLNNQNFNQNMSVNQQPINAKPQPMTGFQQQIMQEPPLQSMNNAFNSGNANNQNLNSKPSKKINLGLIIGIVAVVAVIGIGLVFGSKLLSNGSNNSGSESSYNKNTITIGGIEMPIVKEGMGIYKIRDEYVFRGGDKVEWPDMSDITTRKTTYFPNIVKFGDYLWRIIKVNSDGSIRLVFFGEYVDDTTRYKVPTVENTLLETTYLENNTNFNESSSYENSSIRQFLNNDMITNGAGYYDSTNKKYNTYKIIPTNYENYMVKQSYDIAKIDYNYSKDEFVLPDIQYSTFKDYVGLVSVREYVEASADIDETSYRCKSSYNMRLGCSEQNFLALYSNTTTLVADSIGVYRITRTNGEIGPEVERNNSTAQFYPVINLKSNVIFSKGDGTPSNPYIVK